MQQSNEKPVEPNPAPAVTAKMTETTRRAWKVNFVLPAPQSMPSDRLKARAELVRNALSSTSY